MLHHSTHENDNVDTLLIPSQHTHTHSHDTTLMEHDMEHSSITTSTEELQEHPGARYALMIVTGMNLLNYADRYVPAAVKEPIKRDLNLTDVQTSLPVTAFIIVYMIASVAFSWAADKGYSRRRLICVGVMIWSIATSLASLSIDFWTLLITRALVGVGEGAYATLTPALLSDYYPPQKRARVMSIYNCAIPIGAALGYLTGGQVGQHLGWRAAFLICGLPGIGLALLILTIHEPTLGAMDVQHRRESESDSINHSPSYLPSWRHTIILFLRNNTYMYAVGGYTATVFATGAVADWFPTYLERQYDMNLDTASTLVGAMAVVSGLIGTTVGYYCGEYALRKNIFTHAYFAISTLSMLVATILVICALLFVTSPTWLIIGLMFVAQFFLWFYTGPINAVISNCIPASLRARGFAFSILMEHTFGDAISPSILGGISDATHSLFTAMWLIPCAMLIAALIWGIGTFFALSDDHAMNEMHDRIEILYGGAITGMEQQEEIAVLKDEIK